MAQALPALLHCYIHTHLIGHSLLSPSARPPHEHRHRGYLTTVCNGRDSDRACHAESPTPRATSNSRFSQTDLDAFGFVTEAPEESDALQRQTFTRA